MDYVYGELLSGIERGECYLMISEGESICASVSLSDEDVTMWGNDGSDRTALYFHKLMKAPAIAPVQAGTQLIDFAAHEAIKRQKKYLRCDTKPAMVRLVEFYKRLGFYQKGTANYPASGAAALLFEGKAVDIIVNIGIPR